MKFAVFCLVLALVRVSTAKGKTIVLCEKKDLSLSCDSGSTIQIISANYGRKSSNVCLRPGNKREGGNLNCGAQSSKARVSKECEGKSRCKMSINNRVFGDPCPGTFKYIEVNYDCVEKKQERCKDAHDLVFLVDTSRSISQDYWNKAMSFVSTFTDNFQIGEQNTLVSVVQIAHVPRILFNLTDFMTNDGIKQAIKDKQKFLRGSTKLAMGLRTVARDVFGPPELSRKVKGRRSGKPESVERVLVLLTDGRPNDPSAALAATRQLRNLNVNIWTVALGENVDTDMLEKLATMKDYSLHAPEYQSLEETAEYLYDVKCGGEQW